MYYYYYWLKNTTTGEVMRISNSQFMGDTGEKVFYGGMWYIIEDWVDDYCDFDDPNW